MRRGRAIGREFAGWTVRLSNRKCHNSRTDPFNFLLDCLSWNFVDFLLDLSFEKVAAPPII